MSLQSSPLGVGDEVALFTSGGTCAGVGVWQDAHLALPVWADNPITEATDGFASGDTLRYRVWDASTGEMYSTSDVHVTYTDSLSLTEVEGIFQSGRLYQIDTLRVDTPDPVLAIPQLFAPDSSATGVPTSTPLTWSQVSGATGYDVEVSVASDFSTLADSAVGIVDTSWTISGLADSTVYYWRVRAFSMEDTSTYSHAYSFATRAASPSGMLVAPADSALDVSVPVTFEWRAVDGAQRYNLEVAVDPAFSEIVVKENALKNTRLENVSLTAGTSFYWRVEARGGRGFKKESATYQFTTATSAKAVAGNESQAALPDEVQLNAHYPNPVHHQATFAFALPERTAVTLTVYDMLGRVVSRIIDRTYAAGYHALQWTPRTLPSGQYIYRFEAGKEVQTKLLTIVR